jgi:uncharacterized protein GlcG (DUF336 family)
MIAKSYLGLVEAKAVLAAAQAVAVQNGWNVVIAVLDEAGHLQCLERMDGTQLASTYVAQEKGRTAALFKRSSKALEDAVSGGRQVMLMLPGATPIEGGVPLIYRGDYVGAIGVSGVQSSQDGIVAQAGADYLASL